MGAQKASRGVILGFSRCAAFMSFGVPLLARHAEQLLRQTRRALARLDGWRWPAAVQAQVRCRKLSLSSPITREFWFR